MSVARQDYWQVQKLENPLFKDLIWSQPQNPTQAGKLVIVGGNIHGFKSPADAYNAAIKAGISSLNICLPDSLRKIVGTSIPETTFCPSTPSGSFARESLAEILDLANWADLCLLAGDFGRNSETAIMLEGLIQEYKDWLCLSNDALDYFLNNPSQVVDRANTLIILTMKQLQKIISKAEPTTIIKSDMGLVSLVDSLHNLTTKLRAAIVTEYNNNLICAYGGLVSTTEYTQELSYWSTPISAYVSVWALQNPTKIFEAVTSSIVVFLKPKNV